ncbi:MAG: hypothetical protein FWD35_05160, partial [Oscillospiraceae bacterium]|nr:hypothetical protein [Oscillospiraceae bacterium]
MKTNKRILSLIIAAIVAISASLSAFADEPPGRKPQIDWLIYGAGGNDSVGLRGAAPDASVTGEFSYEFASENGKLQGMVVGDGESVRIFVLDESGAAYTEADTGAAVTFAE